MSVEFLFYSMIDVWIVVELLEQLPICSSLTPLSKLIIGLVWMICRRGEIIEETFSINLINK